MEAAQSRVVCLRRRVARDIELVERIVRIRDDLHLIGSGNGGHDHLSMSQRGVRRETGQDGWVGVHEQISRGLVPDNGVLEESSRRGARATIGRLPGDRIGMTQIGSADIKILDRQIGIRREAYMEGARRGGDIVAFK